MQENKKIAVIEGVKSSKSEELTEAAKKIGVELDVLIYKELYFRTNDKKEIICGGHKIEEYDVIFFRSTKKYWEEVSLIVDYIKAKKLKIKIIDPIVECGRPSDVCKAHQMRVLSLNGIPVPKTVYGGYNFLIKEAFKEFEFPMIVKGSRGDRRTQVFKLYSRKSLIEKTLKLKEHEKEGENKYMLQEYIVNTEDYRVMVVGNKVLGVMIRKAGVNPRLKNVFDKADLPEEIKKLAIRATKLCGLSIGGVDVVFRNGDFTKPLFYEVNKTPNYTRFMETTKIDVAMEIVKFLSGLRDKQ